MKISSNNHCPTTGKRQFVSKEAAYEASAFLMANRTSRELWAYVCSECKCWHLTRQRQRISNLDERIAKLAEEMHANSLERK